jgi:hypothetical protein
VQVCAYRELVQAPNGHDSYGDQASLHPNFFRHSLGAVLDHEEPLPHSVQAAVLIRPDDCFGAHYGLNSDIALGPKTFTTTDSCTATSNVATRSPDRHGQASTEGSRCLEPWQSLR